MNIHEKSRYHEVHARSLRDPEGFWGEVAREIDWIEPANKVFDPAMGLYGRWFVGAVVNTCYNALDRHVANGRADQVALIHDSPLAGSVTKLTYAQMLAEVKTLAAVMADFAAAIKLNPDHPAAKGNYKSLAQELERIGALMAVNNKPSFNCATARRAVEKAICANPELANLDREINAVHTKVVREAASDSARAGRALQREQDAFLAARNASFGRPGYDLHKAMKARLDHLLAIESN